MSECIRGMCIRGVWIECVGGGVVDLLERVLIGVIDTRGVRRDITGCFEGCLNSG